MPPQVMVWVGLTFALAYLPMTDSAPSRLRSVVKTVPLAAFALAAWLVGAPWLLVAALALSALGDLALSEQSERAFLAGLSAFALAHLAYIALFLSLDPLPFWHVLRDEPVLAAALAALWVSTGYWLTPHTGRLTWPVRAYVVLIVFMGLAALGLGRGPVAGGAGLFILSDLVLALMLFRLKEDDPLTAPSGWLVWCFYIAGQLFILTGVT